MKKTKKQGFTLVEIMIVVAIIGLLAAIGIPSFQKARANSIAKSKQNNVRIVNAAIEQYAMEAALDTGDDVTAADYLPYVKGGADALQVGVNAATTPDTTVGDDGELTVTDMYP